MGIGRLVAVISRAVPFFAAIPAHAQAQGNIAPAATAVVDDQRLRAAAADGDWITFGHDYSNQRFAPLQTIDRSNVARLAPAWAYQLGSVGATQTHPLVVGGVMYVSMAGNDVAAIDATTGSEIWRYRQYAGPNTDAPATPDGITVAPGVAAVPSRSRRFPMIHFRDCLCGRPA